MKRERGTAGVLLFRSHVVSHPLFPPLLPPFPFRSYSTSRTCEMSLSNHSNIHFRSLLTLLDEAATPKKAAADDKAAAA